MFTVGCASHAVPQPSSSAATTDHAEETTESRHDLEHHESAPIEQADTVPSSPSDAPAPEGEQAAYERARPVFERYCSSCHTSGAGKPTALAHFAMDRYPFGGHHAAEISATIREVLGAHGQPATMPQDSPGAVQGEELRAILDWADAFDRAHQPGQHSGHQHEH